MLRSVTVLRASPHSHTHQHIIRTAASAASRQLHYVRHTPLSVRAAVRPSTRASHHPTNLPQIFPRRPSPVGSRRNSTVANTGSAQQQQPSRRMRFVRRFVETVSPAPPPLPIKIIPLDRALDKAVRRLMCIGSAIRHRLWNLLLPRPNKTVIHRRQ